MDLYVTLEAFEEQLFLRCLPLRPQGECCLLLQVRFSSRWDAFPEKYAVLWREGGESLKIPLQEGIGEIPWVFALEAAPFYLHIRGERGKEYLSTNQVCGAFVEKPR